MVRFYRFALSGRMLTDPGTDAIFRDILRTEDRDQGTDWGAGPICQRKSGFLEPPPLLGIGFAGTMLGGPTPLVFAFALNRRKDEAGGQLLANSFGLVLRDTLLGATGQGDEAASDPL